MKKQITIMKIYEFAYAAIIIFVLLLTALGGWVVVKNILASDKEALSLSAQDPSIDSLTNEEEIRALEERVRILKDKAKRQQQREERLNEIYAKAIDPANFEANITNAYRTFTPRSKWVYKKETEGETEITEIYVKEETKTLMNVSTIVVWERVWKNGVLTKDSDNWYAQDKGGRVWYFGREERLSENDIDTSWEAGVGSILPSVVMKRTPSFGERYYLEQEPILGEVLSENEDVYLAERKLSGCLKTQEWNAAGSESDKHVFYCPEVEGIALEFHLANEHRKELVLFEQDANPSEGIPKL